MRGYNAVKEREFVGSKLAVSISELFGTGGSEVGRIFPSTISCRADGVDLLHSGVLIITSSAPIATVMS